MITRLRNLILVGLALIAVAGGVRVVTGRQQPSTSTDTTATTAAQDTTRVTRGDVSVTVAATGSIQANQTTSLTFGASGKVTAINVAEGDHVLKGQTLATLDTTSARNVVLQAQAQVAAQEIALRQLTDKPRQVDINLYQAALAVAQAQLKEASSGTSALQTQIDALKVESAKNSLWQTQLTRDANNQQKASLQSNPRTAQAANNLPSDQQNNANIQSSDYDVQIAQANLAADQSKGASVSSIASAQASVTSAQVALNNLLNGGDKDDVAKAQAQLESAQHALDAANAALAKTTLVAPYGGIVATINLHVGEAAPSSAAIVMLDTSSYYVDVPIDETDISQVTVGQPVTLTVDALTGVTVNGKVSKIAATSTLSGNVVTYTVRITVDPAGQPLRSAMSATANIITQQAANALRVPNRFITVNSSTGKATANVRQSDGTFKTVEVTLGVRNSTYTEIHSGLSEGDVLSSSTVASAAGTASSASNSNRGPGGPVGVPGLGGGPGGPPGG